MFNFRRISIFLIFLAAFAYPLFAQQGFIEGTVIDASTGVPIAGVEVVALGVSNNGDSLFFAAHTDPGGYYNMPQVVPGEYHLFTRHQGYMPQNMGPFILGPNTPHLVIDFHLFPNTGGGLADLSGSIIDVLNNNFIYPATVSLLGFSPAGDTLYFVTQASPNGGYTFQQIPSGVYILSCEAPGYQTLRLPNVFVGGGSNTFDIFMLPVGSGGASLSGVVIDAITGFFVHPATVSLLGVSPSGDSLYFVTQTSPNGGYHFADIPPGSYHLSCEAPGYDPFHVNNFLVQQGPNHFDFVLHPGGGGQAGLFGSIFSAEQGAIFPLHPARITAIGFNASGDSVVHRTVNNPDGSYHIPNMLAGTYHITCEAMGYQPAVEPQYLVGPGQTELSFYLQPTQALGSISGRVFGDRPAQPGIAGALVEFISNNISSYAVLSGPQGFYHAQLPPADYIVRCSYIDSVLGFVYSEYYDDVQSVAQATVLNVQSGQAISGIDFGIPVQNGGFFATILGRVSDENNQPIPQAEVTFFSATGADTLILTTYTDGNGEYNLTFTAPPRPHYDFIASASAQGYQTEFWHEKPAFHLADILPVPSGIILPGIEFTLAQQGNPNNSISGQVTDDTGLPISGAFVVGSNLQSGEILFTFSDSSGHYGFVGLPRASFILLYAKDGHVPEFYDNVYTWENATPVFANGDVTNIDASLTMVTNNPSGGILAGTVADNLGAGLNGVFLTVLDENSDVIGYDFTDGLGGYEISGLSDGNYTVQVSKISYASEMQNFSFNAGAGNTLLLNFDLENSPVAVEPVETGNLPTELELAQNFPNPFNPETTIGFNLPQAATTRLVIFNILGQVVKELVNEQLPAGTYRINWDGTNQGGQKVSSGIYLYSLQTGDKKLVRKMLFAK